MQTTKEIMFDITNDNDSCFTLAYIREHKDFLYESLDPSVSPTPHKYRVILSSDDYDYVEDEDLIKELDQVFT